MANQQFIISNDQATQLKNAGVYDKVCGYFSALGFDVVVENESPWFDPAKLEKGDGTNTGSDSSVDLNPSKWG